MITLTTKLDMRHGAVPKVVHLSQYDSDFILVFELYASDGDFTIPSGTTAEIRGTKKSGTGFSADATVDVSAKTVTVTGDQQMTASAGENIYEITLYKNGKELNSANFILMCERAALDMDTITDETVVRELNNLEDFVERAESAAEESSETAESVNSLVETLAASLSQIVTNENDIADIKRYLTQLIFTQDFKAALLACFEKVAWIDGSGQDLYDALEDAMNGKSLLSISATFTQGSHVIYPSDSLDTLRDYLTVSANYSDGTAELITAYALSGQLAEGTSSILVSYLGRTALFTCTVTSLEIYEYKLSDGTLAPFGIGAIGTVDGIPTINRSTTDRRVINIDHGEKPFNIRNNSSDTDIQESIYYPIPIPSDATSATITVTPATLNANGNIRKYENGVFTIIGESQTAAGSITFTFEADDNLYFVGQVRDITDTEPTEVVVTFE